MWGLMEDTCCRPLRGRRPLGQHSFCRTGCFGDSTATTVPDSSFLGMWTWYTTSWCTRAKVHIISFKSTSDVHQSTWSSCLEIHVYIHTGKRAAPLAVGTWIWFCLYLNIELQLSCRLDSIGWQNPLQAKASDFQMEIAMFSKYESSTMYLYRYCRCLHRVISIL